MKKNATLIGLGIGVAATYYMYGNKIKAECKNIINNIKTKKNNNSLEDMM